MYDLPELREATDAWWSGVARALRREGVEDVPDTLTRSRYTEDIWRREDLLLSQTCGYDLIDGWKSRLTYVATPCYAAPGCEGSLYSSVIVVPATSPVRHLEDLRGLRCAINGFGSHSGCNALRATIAPLARGGRFFGSVTVSGSHTQSLKMLEQGQADVVAIDCIIYALMARLFPWLPERVRAIGKTASAPVGPYVTRSGVPHELLSALRRGLVDAMQDPSLAPAREALLLQGMEVLTLEHYSRLERMRTRALALSYRDFV